MAAPSFEFKGKTYLHTTGSWHPKTNRHPTTAGFAWGWIEGAPGNLCWSNDPGESFTSKDAHDVANIHNQWLVDQEPVEIKLVKAFGNLECAERECDAAEIRYLDAQETLKRAKAEVERLEALRLSPVA